MSYDPRQQSSQPSNPSDQQQFPHHGTTTNQSSYLYENPPPSSSSSSYPSSTPSSSTYETYHPSSQQQTRPPPPPPPSYSSSSSMTSSRYQRGEQPYTDKPEPPSFSGSKSTENYPSSETPPPPRNCVPLSDWIQTHEIQHRGGRWEKPNARVVCVSLLNQAVWIKYGTLIASNGRVKLEREGRMEHGVSRFLKKTMTGEGAKLVKAHSDGQAYIYLAERSRDLHLVELRSEADAIVVDGDNVIGFDRDVHWDIIPMKSFGLTGMFNMRLRGPGTVVIGSQGSPMVLHVRDFDPVFTDPSHTIAWSANLSPSVKTDISMRSVLGRGSGDEFQLKFEGQYGFVIVQPKSILEK